MTATDPQEGLRERIAALVASVLERRDSLTEQVPGWRLSRAPASRVEERLAFVEAEAIPGEDAPFVLPAGGSAVVAVVRGSIEISNAVGTMMAESFFVIGSGTERWIRALEYPTDIICMFFRDGGDGGTAAVDRR